MTFISPEDIIADFLRVRLTDPRSRAESSNTEEFNGGGTDFSLTASPSGSVQCVTSVTVDGSAKIKWKDFYWDYQNQKIIFFSATAGGTNNVDIAYKYGTTNWIYSDKPKNTLSLTSFPRIRVAPIAGTAERLGQYNSDIQGQTSFQIDIFTKEGYITTIDSIKYEGEFLARYFAYKILAMFRSYENDLHPALYNFTASGTPRPMPFDREMQCFHYMLEVEMKGINPGESYND